MKHYITLPNGRKVSVGAYAAAYRSLKAAPPEARFPGFGFFPERADIILRAIRDGITERINRHLPGFGVGRNWEPALQASVRGLAYDLARRVIVRESSVRHLPSKILARVAHRLYKPEDL
jgi:hypothetical protein